MRRLQRLGPKRLIPALERSSFFSAKTGSLDSQFHSWGLRSPLDYPDRASCLNCSQAIREFSDIVLHKAECQAIMFRCDEVERRSSGVQIGREGLRMDGSV
jgi:hypothetical protein